MPQRVRRAGLFRQIVDAVPNAMVMVDAAGRVEMVNAHAERLFGYARNEIRGQSIEMLVPERFRGGYPGQRGAYFVRAHPGPMAPGHDIYALRKDGQEFPVEIDLNPIATDNGPMVLAAIVDISDRKREDERVRAALREKDILLREFHHRFKNNLQIVHSLLHLQSGRVTESAALKLLRDSQNRVHSMTLIHQTLYASNDFSAVDFARFLGALLPHLIRSLDVDTNRIAVRLDIDPVRLPIDIAIPCGLVVNELITNAFTHAFQGRHHGEVSVRLTQQPGNEVLLMVADDGGGLPDDLDVTTTDTLGLQLVGILSMQIDGTLSVQRSGPTRLSVRFPIK